MKKSRERDSRMDPEIWSKLPSEILEHILSFLPLRAFLKLRATCKSFWPLLFSPSFVSKHSSLPFSSFLSLSHPQFAHHFPLYDTTLATWRNISLSRHSFPSFTSLSSSGALFCLSHSASFTFHVFNLFSKASRTIPYPTHALHFDHLTFAATPSGYVIFVSTSNSGFLYHSKAPAWTRFHGFGPVLDHQQGVLFNGCLYFATPEPFSVVIFDLESGGWQGLHAGLPDQLTFVRLVSDGEGKLYLVGGVGSNGISRSIKVWEFDGNWWVEMQSLPDLICRKFVSVCYHNYEHVYCFWHQGMICICCYTWPEILYYLVSRRTWHWLPRCPSLPPKCSCGFKWFSFVPNLYASV
ncbi:hypothetical protein Fmac_032335 [Flemingia macrophylla]|uniref:F-box domain-containing protein n=1 Tax=Flemingia macrophylla TaxID=520843 RepID=A0ABD1L4L6_9FABA